MNANEPHVKIVGGPPEFWISPGLWKRNKIAVLIAIVLSILAMVSVNEWMKVRPATVQFFHNGKLITDLLVDWPDKAAIQFDSDTATLTVTRFGDDQKQSVMVSSSVLNLIMYVTAGDHEVIRHYASPKTGRTATVTQTTRRFLGIFETTETRESVSLADSEVENSVIKSTPMSVLVSQVKKEALAATEERPSGDKGDGSVRSSD